MMTVSAVARLMPRPPARVDSRNAKSPAARRVEVLHRLHDAPPRVMARGGAAFTGTVCEAFGRGRRAMAWRKRQMIVSQLMGCEDSNDARQTALAHGNCAATLMQNTHWLTI